MVYPKNFESKIDFATVRSILESKCLGPIGVRCCQSMRFSNDFNTVQKLLEQTNEFLSIIVSGKEFPLSNYHDLTESLNSIKAHGAYMTAECTKCSCSDGDGVSTKCYSLHDIGRVPDSA